MLSDTALPERIRDVEHLEHVVALPTQALVVDPRRLDGDILILGVAGKMGPTPDRLARRAVPEKRIVGVARFSNAGLRGRLETAGIETIRCDLLDRAVVDQLPKLANVGFMVVRKFGTAGQPELTWALNVLLTGMVAETFRKARIVTSSTGCVYLYVLPGVFGQRFDKQPVVHAEEPPTAWLTIPTKTFALFGSPSVPLERMIDRVAGWIERGGPSLGKATDHDVGDGTN